MPTVLRQDGFEVRIYTADHTPPHVHVFKGGGEVVVEIDPLSVREAKGMSRREEAAATRLVEEHQDKLREAWRRFHG